jgi:hypothetical protein
MRKHTFGLTLLELLIAMIILTILVIGFSHVQFLSHIQVISADRRAKLQNDISLILEDISKSVLRATGNANDQGIVPIANGFKVRIDFNNPVTPGDFSDDTWVVYTLSNPTGPSTIDKRIGSGDTLHLVPRNIIPLPLATNFNYVILDNGTGIEITLTGRNNPAQPISVDNPEIQMKSRTYTHSASSN